MSDITELADKSLNFQRFDW